MQGCHQASVCSGSSSRPMARVRAWHTPTQPTCRPASAIVSIWPLPCPILLRGRLCLCMAEASPPPAPPPAKRKRAPRKPRTPKPPAAEPAPPPKQPVQAIKAEVVRDTLQEELDLQERDTDLSIDDIMQLQYEVPTDEQIDQEAEELLREQSEQPWPSKGPAPSAEEVAAGAKKGSGGTSESRPMLSRKAAILLEIISAAGGTDLDVKISQFVDDVDEELLELLQQRIDAVAQVNPRAADQLRELSGVLRVVYNRQSASPATRLLDDVLDVLGDDMHDSQAYVSRRMEAMARLREAFSGGAGTGLDLFAAAAALAGSGPLAAAELASEAVDPIQFVTEATQTLEQARIGQGQLGQDIERAEKEIRYLQKHQPELLKGSQATQHMAQLTNAKRVHAGRAVALSQLQDVLLMARQVTSHRDFLSDE